MDSEHAYWPCGMAMRHIRGDTWEQIDLDGKHICYVLAESVEVNPDAREQLRRSSQK